MNLPPLPTHKHDLEAAERIVAMGMPGIEPILGGILEWFQDYNWPVAKVFEPLFDGMGPEIVEPMRTVLATEDDFWKYWLVSILIPKLSPEAQALLRPDLIRIAEHPTEGEVTEEVHREVLEYFEARTGAEKGMIGQRGEISCPCCQGAMRPGVLRIESSWWQGILGGYSRKSLWFFPKNQEPGEDWKTEVLGSGANRDGFLCRTCGAALLVDDR